MKIITDPVRVALIARTRIDWQTLAAVFEERGLEWEHSPATGPTFVDLPGVDHIHVNGTEGALLAELAGRGCYNSFGGVNGAGMGRSTNREHVEHLIEVGHGSVFEHVSFTFMIWNCSRGLTHELVRHRVGTAFSQASTRFRDESQGSFVVPPLVRSVFKQLGPISMIFGALASDTTDRYDRALQLLKEAKLLSTFGLRGTAARKAARGIARSLLPIGLESPITLTVNARTARNILDQRASVFAEAEIREMAVAMWRILVRQEPAIFGDYELHTHVDGTEYLTTPHRKV